MNPTGLPNLLSQYERLLTEPGVRSLRIGVIGAIASGTMQGFALLALLAGATSLANKTSIAGLSVGGWVSVLALAAAFGFAASYVLSMGSYRAALDLMRNSHTVVGDHMSSLPLGWFRKDLAGRLSRAMTAGMMSMGQVIANMVMGFISNLAALITVISGLWFWDVRLAMVVSIIVPLYIFLTHILTIWQNRTKRWAEPSKTELSNRIVEYAKTQAALRAAGRSVEFEPLRDAVAEENRVSKKTLWFEAGMNLLAGSAAQIIIVVLIVMAATLAKDGSLAPLPAVAFVGLALRLMQHLSLLGELSIGLQEQSPILGVIDEVLSTPSMAEPETSATPTAPTIELNNVYFGYNSDTPVLQGVSFNAPARTMTALVGPSGSGKTTIARLISRFYDVDSGSVRVAGNDVRDYTTADLMAQLSMVFQDVYLFDDTLFENIRVGRDNASHDEVYAAANLAGVTEIADRLPMGWDTRVGEGGTRLSGGERQRVSIARALLKKAAIVLIDEATSALDVENEQNITAAINTLRTDATVLVIAHKLDTIQAADQVIVLDEDGTVAQQGNHVDLVGREGIYQQFWKHREAALGWKLMPS